jgi:RNA polymerase sigma-70 factor (ECF subfamily)
MTVVAEVFNKAAAGDQDAISRLLHAYGPQVRRTLSISPQWQALVDAEDVMQVTYLEAFMRFGQFESLDANSVKAWLTRVAQNNLKDAIKELDRDKRPNPRQRIHPKSVEDSYVALAELIAATTSGTPSRCAGRREAQQWLDAAIRKLPTAYEQVVRMCDLEERSIKDVATAMGRSAGAIKMMRMRAHDRLGELLGSESAFFSRP